MAAHPGAAVSDCPCGCHTTQFAACTVRGGCGHLHSGDDPSSLCYRGSACTDTRSQQVTNPDQSTTRVRIPARATDPGLLCRMDTTMTAAAVQQLPMDYVELSTLLSKTGSIEAPTSGTRELPIPIRLGVAVLAEQIVAEVERWAEVVAADDGAWYTPAGTRLERVSSAADLVAGRFEPLLRCPPSWHARLDMSEHTQSGKDVVRYSLEAGIDGALLLLSLHERTTLLAGRTHRSLSLHAPCPKCHRLALEQQEGSDRVDCRRCGEPMPLDAYEKHAGALAAAYERSGHGGLRARGYEVPA
jgi:hypothetical protein